jgi:hypothetical protein
MKNLIIFAWCLAPLFPVWAQPMGVPEMDQNLRILANLSLLSPGGLGFDNRYEGIQGYPYLFDQWRPSRVLEINRDTFSGIVEVNFDLVRQILMVRLPDGTLGELSPVSVESVVVMGTATEVSVANVPRRKDNFIVYNYNEVPIFQEFVVFPEGEIANNGSVYRRFYEILNDGRFVLLKSVNKRLERASFTGAYATGKRYDEFLTQTQYWLRKPSGSFTKMPLKHRVVLKLLKEYKTKVNEIVKEYQLELNIESDIITLLQILNKIEI